MICLKRRKIAFLAIFKTWATLIGVQWWVLMLTNGKLGAFRSTLHLEWALKTSYCLLRNPQIFALFWLWNLWTLNFVDLAAALQCVYGLIWLRGFYIKMKAAFPPIWRKFNDLEACHPMLWMKFPEIMIFPPIFHLWIFLLVNTCWPRNFFHRKLQDEENILHTLNISISALDQHIFNTFSKKVHC